MNKNSHFVIVIFLGLIFGCTPTNSAVNSKTLESIPPKQITEIREPSSSALSITTQKIVTKTSIMTPKPQPSENKTNTVNPTEAIRATTQRLTQDFVEAMEKTESSFNINCNGKTIISPNGKWLACSHDYLHDNSGMYIKKFSDKDAQDITIMDILVNYDKENQWNLHPILFSQDSTYLYLSSFFGWDGGGPVCFFGFGVNGLYRMNLFTKKVDPIIIPDYGGNQNIFYKFSPTGRRLAYFSFEKQKTLHVLDLKTGKKISYEFPEHLNDHLTWSPDGIKLAFVTGLDDSEKVNSSTVKILDTITGEIITVYHSTDQCLSVIEWEPDKKLIVSGGVFDSPDTIIKIDLNTNSISLMTPTPDP